MTCLAVFCNARIWTVFVVYKHYSALTTKKKGIRLEQKKIYLILFGEGILTIIHHIYEWEKKEYRFSLKKDKVAKILDTVAKLEQVDSTRDVKLRNLRTNDLLDSKDMDRAFGEVKES